MYLAMYLRANLNIFLTTNVMLAGMMIGVTAGCTSKTKNVTATANDTLVQPAATKPLIKEAPASVTVHSSPSQSKGVAVGKSPTRALLASMAGGKTVECSNAEDKRSLAIKQTPAGGCEVLYRKTGQTSSIASAEHELSRCDGAVENVKANLEKAGFTCVNK